MEIIKRGELPGDQEAVFSCQSCKSKMRAKLNEGRYESDFRNEAYVIFACPVCFLSISVPYGKFK